MLGDAAETALNPRVPSGYGGLFYGVYCALVVDVVDPDGQGRIRIRLPWSPDSNQASYEAWARFATMMGGNDRGSWFLPDPDDEVLVAFEGGDPRRPYIVGALWNGQDAPPQSMDSAGNNDIKMLRSRRGITITLDDSQGQETLVLETPGGQKITMTDGGRSVEAVDSNGNSVKLEGSGITVNASAKVSIKASFIEMEAGMVTVKAGMSCFNGILQADTVITPSIIASSYTPGAGNIW